MRKTRFMSLLFLILSLVFFLLPEFRQGLQAPIVDWRWLERSQPRRETLEKLARAAEERRDARTLAFVALRLPVGQERDKLADRAVALDPQLTWIYWNPDGSRDPKVEEQTRARLQQWNPENAIPYLFEAERIFEKRGLDRSSVLPGLEALAKETAWRAVMAKAFAAPRYDTYVTRRFELERALFRQYHLDRPGVVLASLAGYPIPNLLNVRQYGKLLVFKLGKEAEEAGHLPEALGYYWTVAHFGERMQLEGRAQIERLIGTALQTEAYERLVLVLRRMGRSDEAATVEYALQELRQRQTIRSGKDPLAQSSNYHWSVLMVHLFAGLVVVFALLTALTFGYVNTKRWVHPERKGRLYQSLTVAENYAPVLLFLACLGLYVIHYPFAQNFEHYMTTAGEIHDFEPLFYNVLPVFRAVPGHNQLGLGNPFRLYVWYALAGVGLLAVLGLLLERRGSKAPSA